MKKESLLIIIIIDCRRVSLFRDLFMMDERGWKEGRKVGRRRGATLHKHHLHYETIDHIGSSFTLQQEQQQDQFIKK